MASASWPGLTTMRSLAAVLHVVLVDHGYALEAAEQGSRGISRRSASPRRRAENGWVICDPLTSPQLRRSSGTSGCPSRRLAALCCHDYRGDPPQCIL
jgi:hypothetical protein